MSEGLVIIGLLNTGLLVWIAFRLGRHTQVLNQLQKGCPLFQRQGDKGGR